MQSIFISALAFAMAVLVTAQVTQIVKVISGGLSDTKSVDSDAQAIADKVKNATELLLGRNVTQYTVQSYRTQVVSGLNYFLKVYIQDTLGWKYMAHLRVLQPLSGEPVLTGLMFPKMWNDPISYDGFTTINS